MKPHKLMNLSSSAGMAELLRLADEETMVEDGKFTFEEERSVSVDPVDPDDTVDHVDPTNKSEKRRTKVSLFILC